MGRSYEKEKLMQLGFKDTKLCSDSDIRQGKIKQEFRGIYGNTDEI